MKATIWLRLPAVMLGLLYLTSGIGKALDINAFAGILASYSPKIFMLAPFIVSLEIILGFGFLFGIFRYQFARFSFFLLIFFSFVYVLGYFLFDIEDCGCFGQIISMPIWVSLLRNALMISASYFVWKYHSLQPQAKFQNWKFGLVFVFAFIAFIVLGLEVKNTYTEIIVRKGSDLRNTFLRKYVKENQKQLIFIFSPTCPHCLSMTDRINTNKMDFEVVGIYPDVIKKGDVEQYQKLKRPRFPIFADKKDSLRLLTRNIPTIFIVKDGILENIYHSEFLESEQNVRANGKK